MNGFDINKLLVRIRDTLDGMASQRDRVNYLQNVIDEYEEKTAYMEDSPLLPVRILLVLHEQDQNGAGLTEEEILNIINNKISQSN